MVTIVNANGLEVQSTESATCDVCGGKGLRGDFPGQGGIVGAPQRKGRAECDGCAYAAEKLDELIDEADEGGTVQATAAHPCGSFGAVASRLGYSVDQIADARYRAGWTD